MPPSDNDKPEATPALLTRARERSDAIGEVERKVAELQRDFAEGRDLVVGMTPAPRPIEARLVITDLCDMLGTMRKPPADPWFERLVTVLRRARDFIEGDASLLADERPCRASARPCRICGYDQGHGARCPERERPSSSPAAAGASPCPYSRDNGLQCERDAGHEGEHIDGRGGNYRADHWTRRGSSNVPPATTVDDVALVIAGSVPRHVIMLPTETRKIARAVLDALPAPDHAVCRHKINGLSNELAHMRAAEGERGSGSAQPAGVDCQHGRMTDTGEHCADCRTREAPSEDVARMVHAFDDAGRKRAVRDLAGRVCATEDALRTHEADLAAAAGECRVPIPSPGSDMARLLRANVLLRRENEAQRHGSAKTPDGCTWAERLVESQERGARSAIRVRELEAAIMRCMQIAEDDDDLGIDCLAALQAVMHDGIPERGSSAASPGVASIARDDAARALIDAIATPRGRDFRHAWDRACLLFGRFGAEPVLAEEHIRENERAKCAAIAEEAASHIRHMAAEYNIGFPCSLIDDLASLYEAAPCAGTEARPPWKCTMCNGAEHPGGLSHTQALAREAKSSGGSPMKGGTNMRATGEKPDPGAVTTDGGATAPAGERSNDQDHAVSCVPSPTAHGAPGVATAGARVPATGDGAFGSRLSAADAPGRAEMQGDDPGGASPSSARKASEADDRHLHGGSLRFGKEVCPDCKRTRDTHDEWDFRFCNRTVGG